MSTLEAEHGPLPQTVTAETGGGGFHLVFAHPGIKTGNRSDVRPGIDVRGDGGYIVAPPSVHITGNLYRWREGHSPDDLHPASAPDWLLKLIGRGAPSPSMPKPGNNGQAPDDRAKRCLQALLRIKTADHADGSKRLFAAACRCVEFDLNDGESVGAIRSYAAVQPFPRNWTDEEILKRVRDAEGTAQRGKTLAETSTLTKSRRAMPDEEALTKRLADTITGWDHFAVDAGNKLYVFRGGVYHPDGEPHIRRRVKFILLTWKQAGEWTTRKASEVVEFIRVDARTLWERPPLDVVNVANGLLDVTMRSLRPHDPEFLSPIQIPVTFDPAATCPAWENFVGEVFPNDSQAVAWELIGWLMVPWTDIQKAVLLIGEGANGKSTFLRAVTVFIGKRNIASVSLHRMESDRFSAARLVGKLANICADLPSKHLEGTSAFKAIVGGDSIVGERKHVDSFDFTPFCRLAFSANHAPQSGDASAAFFRRWLVIPFTRTFSEDGDQKPEAGNVMDARLADPGELSGLLNKALDALAGLRERHDFTESLTMKAAWVDLREATDPLAIWLESSTVRGSACMVTKAGLLAAYSRHCTNHDRPPPSRTGFGLALRRLIPELQEVQRTVAERVAWCWIGIGLRAEPAGGVSDAG